jgi:hypothetical protein
MQLGQPIPVLGAGIGAHAAGIDQPDVPVAQLDDAESTEGGAWVDPERDHVEHRSRTAALPLMKKWRSKGLTSFELRRTMLMFEINRTIYTNRTKGRY